MPKLPTLDDFLNGELVGVTIPDYLPIPKEILKFMFGRDNSATLSHRNHLRILTHLQELVGWDVVYCGCGSHMIQRKKIEYNIVV